MTDTARLSRNVGPLRRAGDQSLTGDVRARRTEGEDVIDLSGDLPRHEVPRLVIDAASRVLQQNGKEEAEATELALRAAAARRWSLLSGGRPVNADHIGVTGSAVAGCFAACFALFESGDFVLIPTPAPPAFQLLVRLARATPVSVPGDVEWSLKISVDDLARATDARTAGLILGSPVNPTGAVYTRSELQALLEWASGRGLWVVADETHRELHHGSGPAPSVLDLPDQLLERVVVVTEVGAAQRDWRLGITLAPPPVAAVLARLRDVVTGPIPPVTSAAVTAVLADDRVGREFERLTDTARRRREDAVHLLRAELPGVEFIEPLGGGFLFFRVDGAVTTSVAQSRSFCETLLERHGVALAPGEPFGDDRWVRLSYLVPERELQRGVERIAEFIRTSQREH